MLHRQPGSRVEPVFENPAFPDQAGQEFGLVIRDARIQDMMMCPFNDGYGITLDIPDLLDCTQSSLLATTESCVAQQALLFKGNASQSCLYGFGNTVADVDLSC